MWNRPVCGMAGKSVGCLDHQTRGYRVRGLQGGARNRKEFGLCNYINNGK
jgi:hypothetical protein